MPHNTTRIWAGLAIAAVAIPAAGRYYYSSATASPQSSATIVLADSNVSPTNPETSNDSGRDYQAEVDAALSRPGTRAPSIPDGSQSGFHSIHPLQPLQAPSVPDAVKPAVVVTPTTGNSTPVVRTASNVADDDSVDNSQSSDTVQLSDRAVYNIVVDNLPTDQRDTFVQSFALMSPQQKADLLDGFRENLQPKP